LPSGCSEEYAAEILDAAKSKAVMFPDVQLIYAEPSPLSSMMIEAIFPDRLYKAGTMLKRLSMGELGEKTPVDPSANDAARAWFSSYDMMIPGGEYIWAFDARCGNAISAILDELWSGGLTDAAIIADGTVVSAIMRRVSLPTQRYMSWTTTPGSGFAFTLTDGMMAAENVRTI
jgi:hypothetical protein